MYAQLVVSWWVSQDSLQCEYIIITAFSFQQSHGPHFPSLTCSLLYSCVCTILWIRSVYSARHHKWPKKKTKKNNLPQHWLAHENDVLTRSTYYYAEFTEESKSGFRFAQFHSASELRLGKHDMVVSANQITPFRSCVHSLNACDQGSTWYIALPMAIWSPVVTLKNYINALWQIFISTSSLIL